MREEGEWVSPRLAWLQEPWKDVRYAIRQLRQAPVFAVTAVLTVALGIGATTAIFALVHAVLPKPLPVARPEELYAVGTAKRPGVYTGMPGDWELFSHDLYKYLRDHTEGFQSLAAFQSRPERVGVRRNGDKQAAQPCIAQFISGNYFSTFGVPAYMGRLVGDDDDREGAAPVAIMAYRTWQESYGRDPSIVGASFQLNGTTVTVIGVTPPGFFGDALRPELPDFWLPLADEPTVKRGNWINNAQLHWLYLIGRIKPGTHARVTEAQMQTELRQWLTQGPGAAGLTASDIERIPRQKVHLQSGAGGMGIMRQRYSAGLELLMASSGFVLLMVCANLACLMLVRALARRQQTSIRLALGAGSWRIVRQALVEAAVLGLVGGAAGVGIAFVGTRALLHAVFGESNVVPAGATANPAVLAFALLTSVVAALIFGAAPAWSANRAEPIEALRGSGRSTERAGVFVQRALVITQVALCLVLLAVAGLLILSLRNLEHQKLGFDPGQRVMVRIDPNLAGYKTERLEPLYRSIRERLQTLPGVTSVSYALLGPMSGGNWTLDVSIEGQAPPTTDGQNSAAWNRVGPDYFETVGTPILRGRPILESDTTETRHVAVINEAFAQRYFPGAEPIGKHFGPWDISQLELVKSFEVVGLAADAKYGQPE